MGNRKFIVIIASLILTLLLAYNSNAQGNKFEQRTISVVGNGEVFIAPDIANINFSVETTAKTATAAVKENADRTNKVIESLKSQIGKEDKLSTSRYNLSPIYEYNNQTKKSEFKGYKVTNSVSVKTYNIENIGNLIDSAAQAGSNSIEGLSFDSSNSNDYRREALAEAVQDARATADAVANAAGVKITTIYQISPSYSYPTPVFKYDMARMESAAQSPTPIEPGDISIKASVKMVFGIE